MAKKHTYSDLNYKFDKDASGNIKIVTENDSISQSIRTILSTRPGERIMLPEFGSSLYRFIFEPMDEFTTQSMQYEVDAAVRQWEDRVYVSNVSVEPNYDENYYIISVQYIIINTGQRGEFVGALSTDV